ncbi:MAG: glycosyltransferase family 2 protein [Planctomycetota bacterium]|nr:glycosyltransferase family 2 protein [Planctomycetota bacterium]
MSLLLFCVAWTVALVVSVPLAVLGLQCFIALLPIRPLPRGERRRVAVLVPAHNEASVLGATIENVKRQLRPDDRLVVVADNCIDTTAHIGRNAGAEVLERTDDQKRGKGFALNAGVRYLEQSPPEIVIIVDADCVLENNAIDELACAVVGTGRPVQALYLMHMPSQPGPEATVSVFAFLMKNWVRARAMQRMGMPVFLTGTGMAFPWKIICDAPLASGEIVEDLVLGLELTRRGFGPAFCESARVWSDLPTNPEAAVVQRTRWEHGYMGSMLSDIPNLFWSGLSQGRIQLFLVGLDLLVPPLALLVLVSGVSCAVLFIISLWTGDVRPLVVLLSTGGMTALVIVLCWSRFASQLIPARVVFTIPGYVLGKLGIYRRFFGQRQTEWVRTQRDNEV